MIEATISMLKRRRDSLTFNGILVGLLLKIKMVKVEKMESTVAEIEAFIVSMFKAISHQIVPGIIGSMSISCSIKRKKRDIDAK